MNRFDASILWDTVAENAAEYRDEKCDDAELSSFNSNESDLEEPLPNSSPTGVNPSSANPQGSKAESDSPSLEIEAIESAAWSASLEAQTFFVPMHYEPNYRYPLIVWLHNEGYNENQVCQVMPHLSTRNYLATGIRGTKSMDVDGHRFHWDCTSRAAVAAAEHGVLEAINRVAVDYSVHAQRIVLAGYRDGGTMAMRIAMQNPDLFASAVSLGGDLGTLPKDCATENLLDIGQLRDRRLPLLWQWSLESNHYNESRLVDDAQLAASVKSQLEIRQYRNDDEMNTVVLSDLNQWIMNHVVASVPVAKMDSWESSPTPFSDN